MNRRRYLAVSGLVSSGLLGGCLDNPLNGSDPTLPQLVGIGIANWHPESQTVAVRIQTDDDILYERRIPLSGGDPSSYAPAWAVPEDHPTELAPSATLETWVDNRSQDEIKALELDRENYHAECIGIEIEVCPACSRQKGQERITVPDSPKTLIKHTASCDYQQN